MGVEAVAPQSWSEQGPKAQAIEAALPRWSLLVCRRCTALRAHADTARICRVVFTLRPGIWVKESSDGEIHHLRHR